jgi:type IV secretion system protein VirB4
VFDEYSHQNYILDVTKDDQLQKAKGLDIMMNPTRSEGFIMQQLSIMVISDDLDNLEQDTKKLSKLLSSIGIVHVREDINLENIFWSQIPGNFRYMRRNIGNVADNIGPFLSLQLSPHGKKESPWGKYITVMYGTEKSPYFINLHNKKNTGHTCIFGNKNSGKTTFMNFLVSETMKYNPTIIYFALDDTPELFVNAIGGTWHNQPVLPEIEDMNYIVAIIDLLSGKYSSGINEIENKVLDTLLSKIKTLSNYTEISQIIENLDFGLDAANLKNNLFKDIAIF